MMGFDPSRQQATWYQKLGAPKDPRITVADEERGVELDETVRRRLRREQVIGAIVVVIIVALLAAYFILKPQFLGW